MHQHHLPCQAVLGPVLDSRSGTRHVHTAPQNGGCCIQQVTPTQRVLCPMLMGGKMPKRRGNVNGQNCEQRLV